VASKLEELLKKDGYSVSRHRFSDILRETLTLWGIPHGRENEQLLPQIMHAGPGFGEGALSRAMKVRLGKNDADIGILDGVRWREDEKMLRELPKEGIQSAIIHVTASPGRRYARLAVRNRAGEAKTSRADFDRQEKARTEIEIPDIGGRADITLINDEDDIGKLYKEIEKAYTRSLKPLLS
jgi:hypothetical protein